MRLLNEIKEAGSFTGLESEEMPHFITSKVIYFFLLCGLVQLIIGLSYSFSNSKNYFYPLVDIGGWSIEGEFFPYPNSIPAIEVPSGISSDGKFITWRSWSPETRGTQGRVSSSEFQTPDYIAVPYYGFPGERSGSRIFLRCIDNGHEIDVSTNRTNTQWATAYLKLGENFCKGNTRLIAETADRNFYVAVGTPFEINSSLFFSQTSLSPLMLVVFSTLIIFILQIFVFGYISTRFLGFRDPLFSGFSFLGILGMVSIAIYVLSPNYFSVFIQRWFSIILLLAILVVIKDKEHTKKYILTYWRPILVWSLVSIFYVTLISSSESGGGSWAINGFFRPLRWSTDNQLPYLLTEALFNGVSIEDIKTGPWHAFDRTPLLSSFFLILRPLVISPASYFFGTTFIPRAFCLKSESSAWIPKRDEM